MSDRNITSGSAAIALLIVTSLMVWFAPGVRAQDLGPAPVFAPVDPDAAALGRLLFYDPILSGNRNISCATCHHPKLGTSDGVSLSLGEGARGLGTDRVVDPSNPPEQRIPRNAPALWNLGAGEFTVLFHDGRLEADETEPGGIRTPLGEDMVVGFDSVLSAQSMFPVLSGDEMAGHYSENDVAQSVRLGHLSIKGGAWDKIAARVSDIPEYRAAFDTVLGPGNKIRFTDIANVVAAFMRFEWRADDSPFDRYLTAGVPLADAPERGRELFYSTAGCSDCHSGWFQTDHGYHAIAMPQLGPGKAARFETHARDVGRARVTGNQEDMFRFRTPSLRNVAQTAPYGHSGAYATLEAVIEHHLDPVNGLRNYDRSQAVLLPLGAAEDWKVLDTPSEVEQIAAANELPPVALSAGDVADLVAFLHALTDSGASQGRLGTPASVPSGLPVDR